MAGALIDVTEVNFGDAAPETARKAQRRLAEAAAAFDRERFGDARRMLEGINKLTPGVPEVIELLGLCAYRSGKWTQATRELETFASMTGSIEQHPVLADAYRAQRRYDKVEEIWKAIGAASPGPELLEEARIVYAGSLGDQGKLSQAIKTLEKAPQPPRRPKIPHLRRWYALADLYERAGDRSRAKRLFKQIDEASPNFGDVKQRIKGR